LSTAGSLARRSASLVDDFPGHTAAGFNAELRHVAFTLAIGVYDFLFVTCSGKGSAGRSPLLGEAESHVIILVEEVGHSVDRKRGRVHCYYEGGPEVFVLHVPDSVKTKGDLKVIPVERLHAGNAGVDLVYFIKCNKDRVAETAVNS
jgi:hypothetical protein